MRHIVDILPHERDDFKVSPTDHWTLMQRWMEATSTRHRGEFEQSRIDFEVLPKWHRWVFKVKTISLFRPTDSPSWYVFTFHGILSFYCMSPFGAVGLGWAQATLNVLPQNNNKLLTSISDGGSWPQLHSTLCQFLCFLSGVSVWISKPRMHRRRPSGKQNNRNLHSTHFPCTPGG